MWALRRVVPGPEVPEPWWRGASVSARIAAVAALIRLRSRAVEMRLRQVYAHCNILRLILFSLKRLEYLSPQYPQFPVLGGDLVNTWESPGIVKRARHGREPNLDSGPGASLVTRTF